MLSVEVAEAVGSLTYKILSASKDKEIKSLCQYIITRRNQPSDEQLDIALEKAAEILKEEKATLEEEIAICTLIIGWCRVWQNPYLITLRALELSLETEDETTLELVNYIRPLYEGFVDFQCWYNAQAVKEEQNESKES